ncbi:unnamed protein product [Prunus brigantina]
MIRLRQLIKSISSVIRNSLTDFIKVYLMIIRAVLPSYSETEVSGSTKERGLCGKLNKFVPACSGGLDTLVVVPWLRENCRCDVVCFTADVGFKRIGRSRKEGQGRWGFSVSSKGSKGGVCKRLHIPLVINPLPLWIDMSTAKTNVKNKS